MRRLLASIWLLTAALGCFADDAPPHSVGVAKVDITPDFPIRLCGYAARKGESEGVEQHLYARAIAIGSGAQDACVLVTIDATAISLDIADAVAVRIEKESGIARHRLVLAVTHSHTAPCLTGTIRNIFGMAIPPEQQEHIDRYTKLLADRLVDVAKRAVQDLKPATLGLARGSAGFAANRRTKGGPIDHEMPLLVAKDPAGKLRALVVNYACHCTTLTDKMNKTCGDWAGYAAQDLEQANPGAVALVTIGCGADANPEPRGQLKMAQDHGKAIADEAKRLLGGELRAIGSLPQGRIQRINLAFDKLPDRRAWEALAKRPDAIGFNARNNLARLDRGEALPTALPYVVQTWTFGDDLAMVFLAGEVVVDYALRLKGDFDPAKLWVTAYANDVPCYVPSKRILAEGGYEAEGAMVYYGHPGRLAPAVENDIIRTVHELLPTKFRTQASLDAFPPAKSLAEALAAFRLRDDLAIEAVAAEPLIVDPIAIDWDIDGRLWVLEMHDYPSGLHENWTPGGRVKVLESSKGDGHYDKATVFLDGLRFPQGIMAWRKGVLVCAAPDILYAQAGGDPKVLFSGFSPDNQQWSVNGLAWGLDNWVYGASSIQNAPIQIAGSDRAVDLGGRDFRMNPDTLAFEPAAGRTQFCRVRDDWDNWFGNDNSNPLWHYPLPERYVRRNPYVAAPPPRVYVDKEADPTRVFPASKLLERFNEPASANRVTSGCGTGIYRDHLLGEEFYGNAFFCEPVHNLVERLVLAPDGATFSGHRAKENAASEFLASTDNWFRPVQVRTGPDGALWVVDMYRFVIEHPRWIRPERQSRLDVRAGAEMGRIYRIYPKNSKPRSVVKLGDLASAELAVRLDDPSGTLRDIIHRELIHRQDASAVPALVKVARESANSAARLQALCALDGLGMLPSELIHTAMTDANAGVRRNAVRLSESRLSREHELAVEVLKLAADADAAVRYQVALSLGDWDDPRVDAVLAQLAAMSPGDIWIRAAVLSSAAHRPVAVLDAFLDATKNAPPDEQMISQLAALTAATGDEAAIAKAVYALAPKGYGPFAAVADLLDALDRRKVTIHVLATSSLVAAQEAAARLELACDAARGVVGNPHATVSERLAAVRLLAREPPGVTADIQMLAGLLQPQVAPALQHGAVRAMARTQADRAAELMVEAWPRLLPGVRPQVLEALASRAAWIDPLLTAIEKEKIPAAEIPANYRQKLLKHEDAHVRLRAAVVLAAGRPVERAKVIEQFQDVLKLKGDPAAGAASFAQACAACHQLNGVGNAVGPNLSALTDRTTPALLTAILDPNAAVEGQYVAYAVETTDGRSLTGLIADESATGFTVVQANGVRETLSRSSLRKVYSTRLSLMPEGLEQGMKPQDMADLINYVQAANR